MQNGNQQTGAQTQAQSAGNKENEARERGETSGDEAREAGKWIVDGHTYTRQESHGGIRGAETEVVFGEKRGETRKGRYVLVPRNSIQASHTTDGQRNPMHFIPEAQPKDRSSADSGLASGRIGSNLDPERVTIGKEAYVGAPVINTRGEVIQGNNRTIGMQKADSANMEAYHNWLREHAEEFGFTPEQVDQMGDCVLAREVDVDDATAIDLGQKTAQDTESGGKQQIDSERVTQGLQASGKFGDFIEALLTVSEDDEGMSLTETIRKNAKTALSMLSRLGLVNNTQINSAYTKSGEINESAVKALTEIVQSVLFEGGNLSLQDDFNKLPNNVKNALLQTVWRATGKKGGREAVKAIQEAVRAYRTVSDVSGELSKTKDITKIRGIIETAFRQGDMFTGRSDGQGLSEAAKRMAERFYLAGKGLLYDSDGNKMKIKDVMSRVFDNMEGRRTMFEETEPMSYADAVEEAFSADASQRFSAEDGNEGAENESTESRGWLRNLPKERLTEKNNVKIDSPVIVSENDFARPNRPLWPWKQNRYRLAAIKYAEDNHLFGEYTNNSGGNGPVVIQYDRRGTRGTNGGLEEFLYRGDVTAADIESTTAIPQIIEKGIYLESADNRDPERKPGIVKYHYYMCGLKIGDSNYVVAFNVAEQRNRKNRYYFHKLVLQRESESGNELAQDTSSSSVAAPSINPGVSDSELTNRGETPSSTPVSGNKGSENSGTSKENATNFSAGSGERAERAGRVLSQVQGQKRPGTSYDTAELDMDDLGDTRFSVGERRRTEMDNRLRKVRPDLTEEERDALFDYLGTLTKPNGDNDTKLQNATFNWFAKGAIRIPEDMDKVRQAVKVAERFGADTSKYGTPMELIDTFSERTGTDNPIDPDTVPTLSNKADYGNGITVYDVDESEESRQWMRKIIDTHLGKDRNPWCLLAADKDGNLYKDSAGYWHDTYNKYPKRVAFKDGKLLAFFASSGEPTWWDTQDKPHSGIPVRITRKMDDGSGRTATYEFIEKTHKLGNPTNIHKGNKQNGTYEEWYDKDHLVQRLNFKDGKQEGMQETFHPNGQSKDRMTYKDGHIVGTAESWHPNGQSKDRMTYKDGHIVGTEESWHPNGVMSVRTHYNMDGRKDGLSESWYENGSNRGRHHYKNGEYDGLQEEWYENGHPCYQFNYKDGIKDGLQEEFYKNGYLRYRERYENGRLNGLQTSRYENGALKMSGEWKKGKPVGEWKTWGENGQLVDRSIYNSDGRLVGSRSWWDNGTPKDITQYDKQGMRNGFCAYWDESGNLESAQEYDHGEFVRHIPIDEDKKRIAELKESVWMDAEHLDNPIRFSAEERDIVERKKAIDKIEPTVITEYPTSRNEAKEIYKGIKTATNSNDNREVVFYNRSFDKNYRKDGLFAKAVPGLKEAFENSVLAYSDYEDKYAGTQRSDGTFHKEHRNIVAYHNYVGKVQIDGSPYYVHFTVTEMKGESGVHSSFVSNARLYKEATPSSQSTLSIRQGRNSDEVVDANLRDFFERARKAEEKLNNSEKSSDFRASAEERELSDADTRFSVTPKDQIPKKTAKGYKVFVLKDGKLYPPKVNPTGEATPIGTWVTAEAAPIAGTSKTGRAKVKSTTNELLANRPGWHLGEIPYAIQFNRMDENRNKTLFPSDFVWAECEYDAGTDYAEEAHNAGINAAGNFQRSLASLDHLPEGGFYKYRTNPDPNTDDWIITDKMRVNRILSDEEVDNLVREAGREPQTRQTRKNQEQRDKWIEELNRQIGEKQWEENADTRFSASERVAVADEARARLGVELTPADMAGETDAASLMALAVKRATEGGRIPNMSQSDENVFYMDAYRNAGGDMQRELFAASQQNGFDVAGAVRDRLADLAMKDILGNGELTSAERGWLYSQELALAERLGVDSDTAGYVLWNRANGGNDLATRGMRSLMQQDGGLDTEGSEELAEKAADVRFSASKQKEGESAATAYDMRMRSIGRMFSEQLENEYSAIDEMVKAIETMTGKKVARKDDPSLAFNQLTSKTQAGMKSYISGYLAPMWDEIARVTKSTDLSFEDVMKYLHLKHGLERNEAFHQRAVKQAEEARQNGQNVPDPERRDYSGLTARYKEYDGDIAAITAAAEAELEQLEQRLGAENADALWDKIRAATERTLDIQVETGLISAEQRDRLKDEFDYYIPLQGFDEEVNPTNEDKYAYQSEWDARETGDINKAAKGRVTMPANPLVAIAAQAQRSIVAGERNMAKKTIYDFVQDRQDNDLASLGEVWYVRTVDDEGNEVYKQVVPDLSKYKSPEERAAAVKEWEEKMKANPNAVRESQRLSLPGVAFTFPKDAPQHVIEVRIGGELKRIYINGDPRVAQVVNGQISSIADNAWYNGIARITRGLSGFYTTFNPEFFLTNFLRDIQFASANIFVKENGAYQRTFARNLARAFRTYTLSGKYKKGTLDLDDRIQKLYEEFASNGGITGYSQMRSNEDFERMLTDYINGKKGFSLSPSRMLNALMDGMESFTSNGENIARFAAYMTSRQMGRGIRESVADAKDVTVNFNRRGSTHVITADEAKKLCPNSRLAQGAVRAMSGVLSTKVGYAFFNVSVQGIKTWVNNTKKHPAKAAAVYGAYMLSGLLPGFIHGALSAMAGGDAPDPEEWYWNIPEHTRRNNIIIGIGNGRYIKIPLPQEIAPFHALGDIIATKMAHKDAGDNNVWKALESFADMLPLNPVSDGGFWQSVMPTGIAPVTDVLLNKDYRGMSIHPDYGKDSVKPKWQQAYDNTADWAVTLSRLVSKATGGDDFVKGKAEISPEDIEHVVTGYLGGVFSFANRIEKTVESMWDEDERVETRSIPFVNRVIGDSGDFETGSYLTKAKNYAKGESEEVKAYDKGYKENRMKEERRELRTSPEYRLSRTYKRVDRQLSNIDKRISRLERQKANAGSREEKLGIDEKIKELKARKNRLKAMLARSVEDSLYGE